VTCTGTCPSPAASCSAPAFIWPTAFASSAAIRVADLSVVYPIARGTGPAAVVDRRVILLREAPTAQGIFGLLAVVAGIGLITTQGDLSAFRRPRGLDGVRWGTATGSLIASYTVVDGYGVKLLGIHTGRARLGHQSAALLHHAADRAVERAPRAGEDEGLLVVGIRVGALSPLSYILVLSAIQMGAPAQPGRARTRNVDDGRRAVRHAESSASGSRRGESWAARF